MADIIDVNIGDSTLEVFWQDEVELNLDLALMYIKSGQAEIQDYVDNVSKPEIHNYVETEAKPLVTQIVNEIAEPVVFEYIESTVKPDIDNYVEEKKPELEAYVTQAQTYANNSQASATASANSAAAAKTSETNALSSKNSAATSAQNAANSATEAKGYAQDAAASASLAQIENKISNCITKIPDDIKLELSNGTLTLKAGSKVYVPNGKNADGSLKFDVVTIASGIGGYNSLSNTEPCFIFYEPTSNILQRLEVELAISGASDTITGTWHLWYDTTNNICYMVSNTGVKTKISLPLAIVTFVGDGTTKISSIDQVFNGFGYIGGKSFVLPGVEGLLPYGKNADGSLNSAKVKITQVVINAGNVTNGTYWLRLASNYFNLFQSSVRYDIETNYIVSYTNPQEGSFICGSVTYENGRITSFNPKQPIKLADEQDVALLNGDNTYTGTNTYEGQFWNKRSVSDSAIVQQNLNDISGVAPSISQLRSFRVIDKNGKILGDCRYTHVVNTGESAMEILARNTKSDGSEVSGSIRVRVLADGTVSTAIPTPSESATGAEAVNAAWANTKLNGKANTNLSNVASNIDYVVERGGNLSKWYMKFKSGWIIQGGAQTAANTQDTITFLKPFSNTSYSVIGTAQADVLYDNSNLPFTPSKPEKSTTFIRVYPGDDGCRTFNWIAIGQ